MPRKLKAYQTSIGFYDLAIAAPSMKAALEAWGAGSNLFHQGAAKETDDPDVVGATMAKPGLVLKRPAGSSGRFGEHAELPDLDDEASRPKKKVRRQDLKRRAAPKVSDEDARKAAAEFEREQKRWDAERRKEEAVREKERAKREKAIAKAQAALDAAQQEHDGRSEILDAERRDIDKRIEAEDRRWESERNKLKDALRRARE